MNKLQASYLLIAILSFFVVVALLFFAATASQKTLVFIGLAVFFALISAFWAYRFVRSF